MSTVGIGGASLGVQVLRATETDPYRLARDLARQSAEGPVTRRAITAALAGYGTGPAWICSRSSGRIERFEQQAGLDAAT